MNEKTILEIAEVIWQEVDKRTDSAELSKSEYLELLRILEAGAHVRCEAVEEEMEVEGETEDEDFEEN
jgi:CMP-2-keto-3-deoxyoctulosonic acid synthetase